VAVIDAAKKKVTKLDLYARGFVDDSDSAFEPVRPQIEQNLAAALKDGETDPYSLQQVVRRTVGRWVSNTLKGRPMIVPVVVTT